MNEKEIKLYQSESVFRFEPVRQIFLDAYERSARERKIMLDPMDLLTYMMEDPGVEELFTVAGIDKAKVQVQIDKIEEETPKGVEAIKWLNMTSVLTEEGELNALEHFRPKMFRSFVLDQSIFKAMEIADLEGSFKITSNHLLAGMIRHGVNTGAMIFRNLGLSQRQLYMLARVPINTN